MTGEPVRLCPGCGIEARDYKYCGNCGLQLAAQAKVPMGVAREAHDEQISNGTSGTMQDGEESASGQPEGSPAASSSPETGAGPGFGARWAALRTAHQLLIGGGSAVALVVAVVVVLALHSGGNSVDSGANAPPPAQPAGPSDAQVCVDKWNSGATPSAKQQVGHIAQIPSPASPTTTYVTAGYSATVPDRCLITVANVDIGLVEQFQEKSGGIFDYPSYSGNLNNLVESAQRWNAHGDDQGTITIGAP